MKLVLAGSRAHYNIFLEKLWSKDLNTSNYRYIDRIDSILGLNAEQELIKLCNEALVKKGHKKDKNRYLVDGR